MPDRNKPDERRSFVETIRPYHVAIWAVVGLIGLIALMAWIWPAAPSKPTIPYSAFVAHVESGNVSEVTIKDQAVSGQFTGEMQLVGGRVIGPDDPLPPDADEHAVRTVHTFATTIPPGAEDDVLDLLSQHDVTVSAEETEESSFPSLWTLLLISALPTLLLIGVILFVGRSAARGQENVLGFAKSRARRTTGPERPQTTLADVEGQDEAKRQLAQVVDFLQAPAKYHQLGARLPRGILLIGPPGTGKTLLARAIAGEARVPFFSISASEFVEMFVGVGAGRVRDLFKQAKGIAPALVFIDELDAVGRRRGVGVGGGNDEREQTLNQLLVELDGFEPNEEVIILAATNRPDVLDTALLRPGRFDRQVTIDLPDREGREAILRLHARGIPLAPDVDLGAVAGTTPGFSGADLANLVNEAALVAAQSGHPIVERSDLDAAFDRIILGTERRFVMSHAERKLLAYHEAGHALVAHHTPGADPIRKISIVARGRSLGVTLQAPDRDRVTHDRVYLDGRLTIMMGGRAAEQLVFDTSTTGAENDLREATALARKMVGLWGMSADVGPFVLEVGDQHPFPAGGDQSGQDVSEQMLDRSEVAVQRLLGRALETAEGILVANRDQLDALAHRLIERETLDEKGVADILGPPLFPDQDAAPRDRASAA